MRSPRKRPAINPSGDADSIQLHALVAYLIHTHNIPQTQIIKEPFVLLSRQNYSVVGIYPCLTESDLVDTISHQPDIVVCDRHKRIKYIIELDGAIHHTRPGAKRTAKRNNDYKNAKIPFIVIDILGFRKVEQNWFEFLDNELTKMPAAVEHVPECDNMKQ